jgi:hypothetical protein
MHALQFACTLDRVRVRVRQQYRRTDSADVRRSVQPVHGDQPDTACALSLWVTGIGFSRAGLDTGSLRIASPEGRISHTVDVQLRRIDRIGRATLSGVSFHAAARRVSGREGGLQFARDSPVPYSVFSATDQCTFLYQNVPGIRTQRISRRFDACDWERPEL